MNLLYIMDSNLFDSIKAIVSLSPRSLEFNEIVIRNVQSNFYTKFGLSHYDMNFPMPLKRLFGPCTERDKISMLYLAFINGQTEMVYLNLYNASGKILPCHITLRSLNNYCNVFIKSSRDTANINESLEHRAILTIRSASSLGNSQFNGVGLIDINRIHKDYLDKLIGFELQTTERTDGTNCERTSSESI